MELEKNSALAAETPLLTDDCVRTVSENKKMDIRTRLAQDPAFRHKYIKSCWIFWAFIIHGWMAGQLGAALPDLRLIIQTDLQTASLLITGGGIGLPIGGLIIGMVYNKITIDLLLVFMLLGCASMAALLPWCPTFAGMLTICIIFGIFKGGMDIGGNAAIATMWRMEGRQYMQALHFMFSAGGILSPFVTGLFLIPNEDSTEHTITMNDITALTNTTVDIHNGTNSAINAVTPPLNYTKTDKLEADDIKVQYAYMITSALAVSAAIPFTVMYFTEKKVRRNTLKADTQSDNLHDLKHDNRKVITSSKLRVVCLVISAGVLMFYAGVELTIVNFLTTFCLEYFGWTKSASTVITSMFWFTFALGRFSGIFLIRCMTPSQLIFSFLMAMIFSTLGMLIICLAKLDYLMWVFVSLVGYVTSTIWASLMSWLEENVTPITGRIASLVVMAAMMGEMVNPIFIGYMMENVSLLTFVYVPLVENIVCLILFTINHIIVTKYAQPYTEIK